MVETSARAEPSLGGGLVLYAEFITTAGKNSKIKCVWITLGESFLDLTLILHGLNSVLRLLLESGNPAFILQSVSQLLLAFGNPVWILHDSLMSAHAFKTFGNTLVMAKGDGLG